MNCWVPPQPLLATCCVGCPELHPPPALAVQTAWLHLHLLVVPPSAGSLAFTMQLGQGRLFCTQPGECSTDIGNGEYAGKTSSSLPPLPAPCAATHTSWLPRSSWATCVAHLAEGVLGTWFPPCPSCRCSSVAQTALCPHLEHGMDSPAPPFQLHRLPPPTPTSSGS